MVIIRKNSKKILPKFPRSNYYWQRTIMELQ
jgi:hypothetical protein